jgi:hypothetical protein
LPNTDFSGSAFGGNSPTGMGGNGSIIGAVYVSNSVDLNELAFKVSQANQRRFA